VYSLLLHPFALSPSPTVTPHVTRRARGYWEQCWELEILAVCPLMVLKLIMSDLFVWGLVRGRVLVQRVSDILQGVKKADIEGLQQMSGMRRKSKKKNVVIDRILHHA